MIQYFKKINFNFLGHKLTSLICSHNFIVKCFINFYYAMIQLESYGYHQGPQRGRRTKHARARTRPQAALSARTALLQLQRCIGV